MVYNDAYKSRNGEKGGALLQGIIEADETCIGGKQTSQGNKKEDREPAKRGRGTDKDAILGAVERGGKVVTQLATELTGCAILEFIRKHVKMMESELITDEFVAYQRVGKEMKHTVINHQVQFVNSDTHTNTIEGSASAKACLVWLTPPLPDGIYSVVRG
ncbi:MAG: transposase [Candidatus Poribacteria bacterium]|nr:transposase [Candidatus Poribacteria bacterium]